MDTLLTGGLTPLDRFLMGTDALLRNPIQREKALMTNTLKRWNPQTENEMTLGLALDAYLKGEANDASDLRVAFIRVMVDQGFTNAEILKHLDA